eukprot:7385728-Prymnesium_polylepis.2
MTNRSFTPPSPSAFPPSLHAGSTDLPNLLDDDLPLPPLKPWLRLERRSRYGTSRALSHNPERFNAVG